MPSHHSLLNESVPIIAFEKIVEKFNLLKNEGKDLLTIIESIRSMSEIRPKLPGNNDQYSFYQLGQNFETQIEKEIYRKEDAQPILAMETKNIQKALKALNAVQKKISSQRHIAVLVKNPELRPFVREFIAFKFPDIPVLSRKEWDSNLQNKVVGEIELE